MPFVSHIISLLVKCNCLWFCHRVQTTGLGGLKPNTVILGWPYGWRQSEDDRTWQVFLQTVRNVTSARMALLVPKGINFFPDSTEKVHQIFISPQITKITYMGPIRNFFFEKKIVIFVF